MSLVEFHPASIELTKTAQIFVREYSAKSLRKGNAHFGRQIIELTVGIHINAENVQGIRTSVRQLIRNLRWRDHLFGFIPLSERSVVIEFLGGLGDGDAEQLNILADSVVLTSIRQWMGLHSPNSSLRHAVFIDFINGFEIVCFWASQGRDLKTLEDTLENKVIVRIEKNTHEF